MDPNNSSPFRKLLPIYNCIFLFTYLATQTVSHDPKSHSCEPKNCGAGPNISYPFWLSQEQESFCGYPHFMLNCSHNRPVLAISNDFYIIEDIFYANNSMRVVNAAVYEETCPTHLHNISLDRTPFTISPGYTNFSFFYNCTSKPKDNYPLYDLSCATNSTQYSFARFHLEEREMPSIYSCHDFAIAPIHTGKDIGSLVGANYTQVLKMGFLLNWTAHNCSTCERRGSSLNGGRKIILIVIGVLCASAGILFICVVLYCRRNASSTTTLIFLKKKRNQDLEVFVRNHGPLALKRYNLSDVKKMTNFFKDKLGQGGYGIVYKGKLQDGHLVAVKVMQASKGDGEEFINEVASISRTSHVNIVTLLGFCLEGDKRVLIYDFMVNGSLEKFINHENALQANQQLGWDKLYQILVGVARGLEYIAPEVFSRNFGPVSHKSDVYSYGMMALEIAGGRKNHEAEMSSSSEKYFPDWIYRHLELDDGFELNGVTNAEQSDIVRQIAIVGLWCILTNPSDRPSMRKVIEMLEGPLEALKIPPKPRLYSPPRLLSYSSTTSLA